MYWCSVICACDAIWIDKYSSESITSIKGREALDKIRNNGKDKFVKTKISNYKLKLEKVVF